MTFLKRTFLTTVAATAMFGLAAAAHADTVVFSGNAWTTTSSGGGVTSTANTGGSTTLQAAAPTSPDGSAANAAAGSDWVNLSTAITSNTGTWTLNATVSTTVPNSPYQQAVYEIGFGDNSFVSSSNVLASKNTNQFAPTPPQPTPNAFVGPSLLDARFSAMGFGGSVATGSAVFAVNGANFAGGVAEPQTTTSFQVVINTDTPNWTVEFFKSGTLVATTTEAATTLNQLGIDFSDRNGGSSATISGLSLTDQVAAVPEPSTWAMMFLGFAGLGFLSYRKSRRAEAFRFA